jgi:flagellar capping protein FliD
LKDRRKTGEESKTGEELAQKIVEWIDTYNRNVDELNERMSEFSRKNG